QDMAGSSASAEGSVEKVRPLASSPVAAVSGQSSSQAMSQWENVPLLDLQQMQVEGSLKRCIRVLIQINTPLPQDEIIHVYLGEAKNLRPDWNLAQIAQSH
ncbi:MAG: chorismate mutase, partial [Kamptonema sp. SIO4C4]|nr:chorismate mutase [Kamptonema sp. SIO4C4]